MIRILRRKGKEIEKEQKSVKPKRSKARSVKEGFSLGELGRTLFSHLATITIENFDLDLNELEKLSTKEGFVGVQFDNLKFIVTRFNTKTKEVVVEPASRGWMFDSSDEIMLKIVGID